MVILNGLAKEDFFYYNFQGYSWYLHYFLIL